MTRQRSGTYLLSMGPASQCTAIDRQKISRRPGCAAKHPGHGDCGLLTLLLLASEAFEQFLDLAVLFALAIGPFADHLLLGAHMRDQALNGFREIGHGGRGRAVGAAFLDRRP